MSTDTDQRATHTADAPFRDARALVDYAKSLDCIHCGLCIQTCPTYHLTGAESSSPRGRIHLMRAVGEGRLKPDADFAEEMDFCLLCRHCESVCPAGVRFSEMMELTRGHIADHVPRGPLARLARHVGFRLVLPRRGVLRLLGSLLRLAQRLRLTRLAAASWTRAESLDELPPIAPRAGRRLLPETAAPPGPPLGHVALLEGCVMPELYPRVNHATLETLGHLGLRVDTPRGVVCCGSLHAHNGDLEGARGLARTMIAAYERATDDGGRPVPIVVNSAGCGAHMKECHHLFAAGDPWHERARAFAARVVDFSQLAAEHVPSRGLALDEDELPGPVAWDDPCHLCHAQGVRDEPRAVLDSIAGIDRVELPDSEACCGSAGIYSLLRPADSRAVFARKLEALRATPARTIVTGNPGCQMQWETGLRRAGSDVRVVHLAEVLVRALRR